MASHRQLHSRNRSGHTRPRQVRSSVIQTVRRGVGLGPAQLQQQLGNRGTQAWLAEQAPVQKIQMKDQSDEMHGRKDMEGEELLQGRFEPAQSQEPEEEEELLQAKFAANEAPAQFQGGGGNAENRTGMPDPLKSGLEQLSGMDLSGVRVHKNSSNPAQLNAFAYTQGQDIHVAPGQEKHLPHEGWHAVQQMQGRVQPTTQAKGTSINDDAGLEREADVMGTRALQIKHFDSVAMRSGQSESMSLQRHAKQHGTVALQLQQPPTTSPAATPSSPTTAQQRTYQQALTRLQALDSTMHSYISQAPLNGGVTRIRRESDSTGTTTNITEFNLQTRIQALPNAFALLERHQVQPPVVVGTTRTQTVAMTLTIDPPSGTNDVTNLTESLYHEGLHMLLHMDQFLPVAKDSPHTATLVRYRRIAQAHADRAPMMTELQQFLLAFFQTQVPGAPLSRLNPLAQAAADSIVSDLIEEKFVENTVASTLPRARQANGAFATQHFDGDLASLGMTTAFIQQHRSSIRSILTKATNILNGIDQQLSRRSPPGPRTSPGRRRDPLDPHHNQPVP